MTAGRAGGQRLRPHGDARPPHEQGAGALRFGSDGAAVGADGGRPTSRGLPPAVRWATLPCPGGQGTLQVCVFDAVCPAGKGATERRAGSWRVAGKKQGFGTFRPSRAFLARRGTGPPRVSLQGGRRYTPSRKRDASLSCHPFHVLRARQARCFTRHIFPPSLFAANIRRVNASKARLSPFPSPPHPPAIPPGERRALPAPAQGSKPLRIPFWERLRFPPFTPSPTPQAASPCSWTCRRVRALPPDRNETKQVRPLLMGRTCVTHAPTALAAGPAGSPWSQRHRLAALPPQRHWLAALPPLPHKGR